MEAVTITGCFPELYGFALVEPGGLRELLGADIEGKDLLDRFTSGEDADRAAAAGVALPILDVEPGYYTITLREPGNPAEPAAAGATVVSTRSLLQVFSYPRSRPGGDDGAYDLVLTRHPE